MCWFLVCMDCRYKCYTGTICNNDAPPFCLSILGQLDVNSRWRTLLLTDTHQARIILLIPFKHVLDIISPSAAVVVCILIY